MIHREVHDVEVPGYGITFSTGKMATQANGSVTVQLADTIVFVSACAANTLKPDQSFFPLTVDYREKFSAAGRFPGGFFKREGKPSEKEVLTSRLCDRPLRPLFPEGFMNEVQVIGLLLSADLSNEPDVLMVNGASAALMVSDIPWKGPIGCVRIGDINGKFVVNPNNDQMYESALDLIYVGNENEMMMIEGSADQVSEVRFIEALEFAHQAIQPIIEAQKKLAVLVGKKKREFPRVVIDAKIKELSKNILGNRLETALYENKLKLDREMAVSRLFEEVNTALEAQLGDEFDALQVKGALESIQEQVIRENILNRSKRLDGRGAKDLRHIACEVNSLPRVHGSAIFQRGETQALAIATLGTGQDIQDLDGLTGGAESKSFMLHYNFPPFSVGETGRFFGPGRREIGHGALAERALVPIVPPEDEFAYAVRIVCEIMESNGSTSMASVCAGCLALMDAGVPIIAPVAGISTGLVTQFDANGNLHKHIVITDILGAEDAFGDMDFKIAGTAEGITGFQLDLKIQGLPLSIAKEAIYQNLEARKKILEVMNQTIDKPRETLKDTAPRIKQIMIDPEKIGALIGPGGKNIKRIIEITGAQIDIDEDNSGRVRIYSNNREALERAIHEIEIVTGSIEIGKTYRGIVRSVKEFGCFVECLPGQEGLVHVSELAEVRVNRPEDVCRVGDEIMIKCIGIDDKGRVRLSRKAALCEARGELYTPTEQKSSSDRGDRGNRYKRRQHAVRE